ncbi:MAG: zinc metalloprotease [Segetibacter sp.]|nr:zinc metalloprotease [Segetibacter sp.]
MIISPFKLNSSSKCLRCITVTFFFIIQISFPEISFTQTIYKILNKKGSYRMNQEALKSNRINDKVNSAFSNIDSVTVIDFISVQSTSSNRINGKAINDFTTHAEYIENTTDAVNEIASEKPQALSVILAFKGKRITLNLVLADLFTPGFKVLSNNSFEVSKVKQGTSYQGIINGETSLATFNFFENEFSGLLCTQSEGNINIGKMIVPGTKTHILYSDNDIKATFSSGCETDGNISNTQKINSSISKYNISNSLGTSLPCVTEFWEVRYETYVSKGSNAQTVNNFVVSVFNVFNTLYQNESIGMRLNNIYIWTSQDPYPTNITGPPSTQKGKTIADDFSNRRTNFGANLALLLGNNYNGYAENDIHYGEWWTNSLCVEEYYHHAYCGGIINDGATNNGVNPYPNYSFAAWTTTHETGHNLGSRHTHACVWGSNHDQPIDGCGPTIDNEYSEGDIYKKICTTIGPIPAAGTIMSYCSLLHELKPQYNTSIDFTKGFSEEPGNVIRSIVSRCIATTCDGNYTCFDKFEPNNAYTSANLFYDGPLGTGTSDHNINANIGYQDDVDWYKVTLASCGSMTITLSNLPNNYDIELYPSGGSTQQVIGKSSNTGTQSETINFQSTSSATTDYYIKIYSFDPTKYSNASCYNLRVQWTSSSCVTCTAPSITTPPTDKSLTSPTGTSFSISASGSNNSYRWQYNKGSGWLDVPNSTPYSGTTSRNLIISSTSPGMNGYQYKCIVSSSCTTSTATSSGATLTVSTASSACNNDNSCAPKPLSITSSCFSTSCTTIGATNQTIPFYGGPNCSSLYRSDRTDDDVWFSITPTSASPVTIKVTPTSNLSNFDPSVGWYSGSCSAPSQVSCATAGVTGQAETLVFTPTSGTTYFIRVFSYDTGGGYSGNFDICVTAPGQANPLPDLIITNPQTSVNSVCPCGSLNVSYGVTNNGSASASSSTVKYYLSSDNSYSSNDVLLGSTSINSVSSNATISNNATLTIPAGTSIGDWYILIIADADNNVTEGTNGEANNVFANTIQTINCSGSADLTIHDLAIDYRYTSSPITPGTAIQLNYTSENTGSISASPIQIGIYLSQDNIFNSATDEYLGNIGRGILNARQTLTEFLNFTIPYCHPCGTYYVFLVMDDQNIITETNKDNNYSYIPFEITGCVTCNVSIPSTGLNFQSAGGSGNINVTAYQCCPWTATTTDSWITITNGFGTGNGAVSYSVSPCNSGGTRNGTIYVNGLPNQVTQSCIESCNGSQSFVWAAQAGSSVYSEYAYDATVDATGNVYMTGSVQGSCSFGNAITLTTPSSGPDVFVSKHNALGKIEWAANYGNTGQEQGLGIAKDNSGNIYVTGYFSNSVTFGSTTLTSNASNAEAAFIIKLNPSGVVQWAQKINASDAAGGTKITIDKNDNIFVSGNLNYSSGLFIAEYNTSGDQIWYHGYGSGPLVGINGISCDNTGNITICGRFMSSITLGATTLTAMSTIDGFIAKLNSGGYVIWAKQVSSLNPTAQNELKSVATDTLNNIYTVGNVDSTAIVGNIIIPLAHDYRAIVIKYDLNGNPLWAKASPEGFQIPVKIAIANDNGIYFAGYFGASMKLDTATIIAAGSSDGFIVRMDDNGKVIWMKGFGAVKSDEAYTIALNSNSDVFVAGGFSGSVPFGSTTLTSAGGEDIFLTKFKQCVPPVANITYSGDSVLCPGQSLTLSTTYCSSNVYQWQLNGVDIPAANNPTYIATAPSSYKVKVSAYASCETLSDAISIKSQGIYTFTGNGNWNVASNWSNNAIPPSILPSCYEIIINHQVGGECILNVPQTILGGKITVAPGKKFTVQSILIQ